MKRIGFAHYGLFDIPDPMSSVPATAVPSKPSTAFELGEKRALETIAEKRTDELVFVLCGPIGTPLHEVAETLNRILTNSFGYNVVTLRPSTFIRRAYDKAGGPKIDTLSPYNKVKVKIDTGNSLRAKHGPSILAELAVKEIAATRVKKKVAEQKEYNVPDRVCHIIDSVKNQSELDLLRSVYGNVLYCIGVFSPEPERNKQLEKDGMSPGEIGLLIDRDSGEDLPEGQTVEDTFPKADYFLRVDETTRAKIDERLIRFIEIILGTAVRTATRSEAAMYMAATAACNSACLSRQVGAAITNAEGELLSVGWNDVPKFGGNLYTTDSPNDHRCFRWDSKECHNDAEKQRIISEIVGKLNKEGIVPDELKNSATDVLKKSSIKYLLEFSRAVHAEMHAIIMAGHLGKGSLVGAKLFCTTYPCHSCARHIVAAGISEVYFIEPYAKSLATRLHYDSISDLESVTSKLRMMPFDGIAPNRYRALFEKRSDRKKGGKAVTYSPVKASVRLESYIESYPALEAMVVKRLAEHANEL